jgi:GH24 family phage-related lysozyme (muramidase)
MKFYQYYEMMNEGRLSRFLGKAALATGLTIGAANSVGSHQEAPQMPSKAKVQTGPIDTNDFYSRDTPDKADVADFEYPGDQPPHKLALPSEVPVSSVSSQMLDFIKKFEGFYSKPYYDQAGVLTVGYGFTKDDIPNLKSSYRMTREEADAFLEKRLAEYYMQIVLNNVTRAVTPNQLTALTSFAYNVGEPAFKKSTVLKKFNAGDIEGSAQSFHNWKYINGERSKGLETRRREESNLFLSED